MPRRPRSSKRPTWHVGQVARCARADDRCCRQIATVGASHAARDPERPWAPNPRARRPLPPRGDRSADPALGPAGSDARFCPRPPARSPARCTRRDPRAPNPTRWPGKIHASSDKGRRSRAKGQFRGRHVLRRSAEVETRRRVQCWTAATQRRTLHAGRLHDFKSKYEFLQGNPDRARPQRWRGSGPAQRPPSQPKPPKGAAQRRRATVASFRRARAPRSLSVASRWRRPTYFHYAEIRKAENASTRAADAARCACGPFADRR